MWEIVYAKQAVKNSRKIKECGLKSKVTELLAILSANPLQNPFKYCVCGRIMNKSIKK